MRLTQIMALKNAKSDLLAFINNIRNCENDRSVRKLLDIIAIIAHEVVVTDEFKNNVHRLVSDWNTMDEMQRNMRFTRLVLDAKL